MIKEHDIVEVNAELAGNTLVEHDFVGTVISLHTRNGELVAVEVEDQDNDVFTVEAQAIKKV